MCWNLCKSGVAATHIHRTLAHQNTGFRWWLCACNGESICMMKMVHTSVTGARTRAVLGSEWSCCYIVRDVILFQFQFSNVCVYSRVFVFTFLCSLNWMVVLVGEIKYEKLPIFPFSIDIIAFFTSSLSVQLSFRMFSLSSSPFPSLFRDEISFGESTISFASDDGRFCGFFVILIIIFFPLLYSSI